MSRGADGPLLASHATEARAKIRHVPSTLDNSSSRGELMRALRGVGLGLSCWIWTREGRPMTSAERALAEALAFTQGVGDTDPNNAVSYVIEQLALRGFSVQPKSAPLLHDLTPETLLRVRKALGITQQTLAAAAGVSLPTVGRAERVDFKTQQAKRQAIGGALVRLGARRAKP